MPAVYLDSLPQNSGTPPPCSLWPTAGLSLALGGEQAGQHSSKIYLSCCRWTELLPVVPCHCAAAGWLHASLLARGASSLRPRIAGL